MVRINLLPIRETLRKREFKQFALLAIIIIVSAFGLMVLSYTFFTYRVSSLEGEQKVQQTKLNKLKEQNKEIEALKNEITRLQKQVDTIERLTKIRDTPAPFMAALSLAIPDEVWISAISKTGRNFTLDGTGIDNTVVVNFVERLQKVRQGFTDKQPWTDPNKKDERSYFGNVKLVQIVASSATAGLGTMSFKIVGNIQ
ncbi:MAG: PilN domain-containing protein [Desulfomonile tiedjei]|nr:PilN domain-containing protein [Desulfomonile tiedjei]